MTADPHQRLVTIERCWWSNRLPSIVWVPSPAPFFRVPILYVWLWGRFGRGMVSALVAEVQNTSGNLWTRWKRVWRNQIPAVIPMPRICSMIGRWISLELVILDHVHVISLWASSCFGTLVLQRRSDDRMVGSNWIACQDRVATYRENMYTECGKLLIYVDISHRVLLKLIQKNCPAIFHVVYHTIVWFEVINLQEKT